MNPICTDFNFPNPDNVSQVVAPLLSAELFDGSYVVRATVFTANDLTSNPSLSIDEDGVGTITYATANPEESPANYYVWYLEETVSLSEGVDQVSISAIDNSRPPHTSRGTKVAVGTNTGQQVG